MSGESRPAASASLPAWSSVLAVVGHPDDESFGLGAFLDAFNRAGTRTSVLCLTHGEASTVHGVAGSLAELRGQESAAAARMLGVADLALRDYPDGGLDQVHRSRLVGEVIDAAAAARADGLLVFDPSGLSFPRFSGDFRTRFDLSEPRKEVFRGSTQEVRRRAA